MLQVGDKAPVFVAPGTEGDVDLAFLLDKGPLVLYFFPRAFTPG
jgi:peroxiredoxin